MIMNTKTEISTAYAPFVLTENGRWHKIVPFFFKSQECAERELQKHKEIYKCTDYKVMKRTIITTMSEWEDLTPAGKECEK